MPRNPNKRNCSIPDCKAWAIRASEPPLCAPHSGLTGAPKGNQNRLVHGFYATAVHPNEQDDLAIRAGDTTLASEINIKRIALRRIFAMLVTGQTLGENPRPLDAQDYACYVCLAFHGAGAISRLLRANHAVGGQSNDIPEAAESALDELGNQGDIDP